MACDNDDYTKTTLEKIQKSGNCWCGGSTWLGESVIRVSICSWATTEEDIEKTIQTFVNAKNSK